MNQILTFRLVFCASIVWIFSLVCLVHAQDPQEKLAERQAVIQNPTAGSFEKAAAQLQIGILLEKSQPEQARAAYEKLLADYPQERYRCAQALVQIGNLLKTAQKPDEAQKKYFEVLANYPDQTYWVKAVWRTIDPVAVGEDAYRRALRTILYANSVRGQELSAEETKALLQDIRAALGEKEADVPPQSTGAYTLDQCVELGETILVPKQPALKIHMLKVEGVKALRVSGILAGVYLPQGVEWRTDAPKQELKEGNRIVINRDYRYGEIPERLRGLTITVGMVDQPVKFEIVFSKVVSTEIYFVGVRELKVEKIDRPLANIPDGMDRFGSGKCADVAVQRVAEYPSCG